MGFGRDKTPFLYLEGVLFVSFQILSMGLFGLLLEMSHTTLPTKMMTLPLTNKSRMEGVKKTLYPTEQDLMEKKSITW